MNKLLIASVLGVAILLAAMAQVNASPLLAYACIAYTHNGNELGGGTIFCNRDSDVNDLRIDWIGACTISWTPTGTTP